MPTTKKALVETLAEQSFMLHVLNKRRVELKSPILAKFTRPAKRSSGRARLLPTGLAVAR